MRKRNSLLNSKCYTCLLLCLIMIFATGGCTGKNSDDNNVKNSVYANVDNWVYAETDVAGKDADVFFVNPTVYKGTDEELVWEKYDKETKKSFVGAVNMEKGIYDDNARFFAPYYHQAALSAYYAPKAESKDIFDSAYSEVRDAFEYYMESYNDGRPLILAGFSQGAQHCIRLLKEYSDNEKFNRILVACYAIGWRFTEQEQAEYPDIQFAQGEKDTGVLIAFNSEAVDVQDSLMIPKGTKTLAINPLNWKNDGTVADKSMNLGACFTDYEGKITKEIPHLTGAYIDDNRGALKVTDVNPKDYPSVLFSDGIYHIYDYQFFYRNLEKNVQTRIESFLKN